MNIKMSRINGKKRVSVSCDKFTLDYTKGYGILKLFDRTIIDCNLLRLVGYNNYDKKGSLGYMLSKFMGE